MASFLYDAPAFVTETYALLNPFHVCDAYGRYAPDFSYPLRAQSVLLDGFKRTFIQSLKRKKAYGQWTVEGFKQQLEDQRTLLIMSQEYLIPLLIQKFCEEEDELSPFFRAIFDFFIREDRFLKDHIRKLLTLLDSSRGFVKERLRGMVPFIMTDESGVYFPFCYMLPPDEALILKDLLLQEMDVFPPMRPDFKNGVYRNVQALMRTVMNFTVGQYLGKLKEHEKRILEKRKDLEEDPQVISSFRDMLMLLSPAEDVSLTEDELIENIRVHGRSVSFIVDDEEYILKVRKGHEDMYDHAEIACGLERKERDILDHYGRVFYGHMEGEFKNFVHRLILDRSKNPRISLKEGDLTDDVVLFRVRHVHYFEYLSDPKISFETFKDGLRKTMEQAFRFIKEEGRFMETLSDIAHDRNRPGIFLPMIYFLDYVNGIFLGTFLNLIDSFKTMDACPVGLRDLGNALRILIKENMAFSVSYRTYLEHLSDYMKKEGLGQEFDEMILINNMQEALGHTLMTAPLLLFIRLWDHPKELTEMTSEQFVKDLESVLIQPFLNILGSKESVDRLRPLYQDMLKEDFEDFKSNPHHFENSSSIFRHGDLSRNHYYQSFIV